MIDSIKPQTLFIDASTIIGIIFRLIFHEKELKEKSIKPWSGRYLIIFSDKYPISCF